jgi:adenosylcobinamide-GDP ribazoletransferase
MRERLAEEWIVFLLALQFLTRLPLPAELGWSEARMAATPRWHPAVGALVGAAAAAVYWAAVQVFPPLLAVLLSTAAGVLLTGAFHEDGFADACDGLGGGTTRERALAIMRDSRLGTYGALGLGLMLAGKVAALAALPPAAVPVVLVAGHAASRASSVAVLATSAYVRDHGTGKPVAGGIGPRGLVLALGTGAAAVLACARTARGDGGRGAGGAGARPLGDAAGLRAAARRLHRGLPRRGAADERGRALPRGARVPLILLRHLAPVGGEGLCYGRSDLAPGPGLRDGAKAIARGLPPFDAVASSPLRRCRALAEAIAEPCGLAVAVDERLAEIDFGAWEGRSWGAIPRHELDAWASDLLGARPHGGESVAMLTARVAAALADWRGRGGSVLLVAHAGVARAARALAGAPDAWTSRLGYGEWMEL